MQSVTHGITRIPLRIRSARAVFCQVLKQALEAFHSLGFHDLCWQHVVDADSAQRRSFHNGSLSTIYVLMQPESVTFETRGRSVHSIVSIKPLLTQYRSVDKAQHCDILS